ncbi:MAG: RDD family protein [Pseudomonadota bacterium]|nr:RDD family protein [Pseudomonadota bacterium]
MTDARPNPGRYRPLIGWRLLALLYDFFPILGIWFVVVVAAIMLHGGEAIESNTLAGTLELLALIAATGLYATASWRRGEQTIGMKPWRLYVVSAAGERASFGQLWIRYLVGIASLLLAGAGFWWAWLDRAGLTLHDRLSGTRMIRDFQRDALLEARSKR